ncbi:unnamed protein product [Symbiodinium pilosum]|uniref:Uncharacterized protein n=1 Tax=Symbiodinium pilosum TaxID=2952 RepID=A0A812MQP3_SYMPI|nr:unnamed protein product [Symbiodinium pilosum]
MFLCFPDTSALSQGAKLSWVEFFAGRAEATRVMRLSGRTAAKVDVLYHTARHGKMNYMDINSPAGMALAIALILKGDDHGFLCHFGLKCASWTSINQATSMRSACSAIGNTSIPSVQEANAMVSRLVLLCILTVAAGGTFTIEQPSGSFFEFYPRFRSLIRCLEMVHKTAWWMRLYGSVTPKRHWAWSNSREYPRKFGLKFTEIFAKLLADSRGRPALPSNLPSLEELFSSLDFEDNWDECDMVEVCRYLRGGKNLSIPASFRHVLPEVL